MTDPLPLGGDHVGLSGEFAALHRQIHNLWVAVTIAVLVSALALLLACVAIEANPGRTGDPGPRGPVGEQGRRGRPGPQGDPGVDRYGTNETTTTTRGTP